MDVRRVTVTMRLRRLVFGVFDWMDYHVTSARLRVLDWICGPLPLTPDDEQRERDRDRLRKSLLDVELEWQ
jgi:hypothetical protein